MRSTTEEAEPGGYNMYISTIILNPIHPFLGACIVFKCSCSLPGQEDKSRPFSLLLILTSYVRTASSAICLACPPSQKDHFSHIICLDKLLYGVFEIKQDHQS